MKPAHSSKPIGLLVAQLGTPDAPTPQALTSYLRQFLSDRRVIDYHPLLWQPILRGIILRTRPRRSARLYSRIWMDDGSPLLIYSQRQVKGLQARLGGNYRVILGMRYGNPSIESAVHTLEAEGIDRIIVLPMFPQFSCTTTASIHDAVNEAASGHLKRFIPSLHFVPPYYDDPGYIAAMRDHLQTHIAALDHRPDKFILSFHGIPNRYHQTGDPYRTQCEHTAALLAEAMGWRDDEWMVCFQSRFGPEEWLTPYTDKTLEALHHMGVERPLVFSPGFVADCLETLDELGNEGRAQFVEGGGKAENFTYVPCLNDFPGWLDALAEIIRRESLGWVESATFQVGDAAEQNIAQVLVP
jgi:ferrochelatase